MMIISTVFALVIGVKVNGEVWEAIPHVANTLSECLTLEHEYTTKDDLVVWSGCYKAEVNNDGKLVKFY